MSKDEKGRRDGILNAAGETFIRYGFRKTSMDDVARAAGLSRQSLYAYFPTKEALFGDMVEHLVAATREACRAALARENVELEARLVDSFDAMYGSALDDDGSRHLNELFAAAEQLLGDVVRNMERTIVADIARVFRERADVMAGGLCFFVHAFCVFGWFVFFNGKFSASARWAASGVPATFRTEFRPPKGLGTVSLASGSGIHWPSTTRQYS